MKTKLFKRETVYRFNGASTNSQKKAKMWCELVEKFISLLELQMYSFDEIEVQNLEGETIYAGHKEEAGMHVNVTCSQNEYTAIERLIAHDGKKFTPSGEEGNDADIEWHLSTDTVSAPCALYSKDIDPMSGIMTRKLKVFVGYGWVTTAPDGVEVKLPETTGAVPNDRGGRRRGGR